MSPGRAGVAVVGAAGRMGRFACGLLEESPEFALVARIVRGDSLAHVLAESGAVVALDVTVAGLGAEHGRVMLDAGVRPVIGTSGVAPDEVRALDEHARARGLGGLVVPNFSLGMACLNRAAELVARHFESIHVLELHHERKRDAPSASARATAARLARARGGASVPIQSVRSPGLYAHQEVLLGRAGETLTLRHDMQGPEAFGPGILAALRHALRARGVALGLEVALGDPPGG